MIPHPCNCELCQKRQEANDQGWCYDCAHLHWCEEHQKKNE